MNWRLAAPEMLQIVEDAQAKVVVVGSEFFDRVEAIEDRLTTVGSIVAIGDHARWPGFDDWVAGHLGLLQRAHTRLRRLADQR